jgi:hypothetical protein
MSDALYPVRVYFDGSCGCVKVPGVYRRISKAPTIPGLPKLWAVDYAPQVGVPQVHPWEGVQRDMRQAEIDSIEAWLVAVQAGDA